MAGRPPRGETDPTLGMTERRHGPPPSRQWSSPRAFLMSAAPIAAIPDPVPFDQLAEASGGSMSWLWDGYLGGGAVTLLTSRWKAGKTTLLSILLAKMGSGSVLAGLGVAAGGAVVVSEEPRELWVARGRRLGLGRHVSLLCRPFRGKPTVAEWGLLIDRLAR